MGQELRDAAWYRNYRNLHFRSFLVELSATAEVHILKFKPGNTRTRWTPYFTTGIAVFAFNPKAEYNGQWVALQPLGTEGQGLPEYPNRKKYSRVQPAIPLGFGVKVNLSPRWVLGLETGHRVTFTDYMDDVSTTYVGEDAFLNAYGPAKGKMVYELSRRSPERDPEGSYGSITQTGEHRGNPRHNDAYMFTSISITYVPGSKNKRPHLPEHVKMGRAFY